MTHFSFHASLTLIGPAGIYAKVHYHEILANVDWLHGCAESMLTLTNLFIIFGFRQTRPKPGMEKFELMSVLVPPFLLLSGLFGQYHSEPANALSVATWLVHSSSLLEWLVAMKLIWEHSETSLNPRWKGMTLAMIPSHVSARSIYSTPLTLVVHILSLEKTSGICACTYHLFFNSPVLNWIVALQAGLTFFGNRWVNQIHIPHTFSLGPVKHMHVLSAMALAAYRIFKYEDDLKSASAMQPDILSNDANIDLQVSTIEEGANKLVPLQEGDITFTTDIFIKSLVVAVAVKYGELWVDFPFDPSAPVAAAIIALPTVTNILKWAERSRSEREDTSALNSSPHTED